MNDPLTYTMEQAAEAMQVSVSTVRRMIDDAEMPVVRLRGNVRIPKSALATWLDERAMAALRDQIVTDYITGRNSPTVAELIAKGRSTPTMVGLGARRKPRVAGNTRAAVAAYDHSSEKD